MKRNESIIKKVSIIIISFFIITLILGSTFTIINMNKEDYKEKTKISYAIKDKSGNLMNKSEDIFINDIGLIDLNIEYYNDKKDIQDDNKKVLAITNVFVNSTIATDELSIITELPEKKESIIEKNVTNISITIKYGEILKNVKERIIEQGYDQIINEGMIQTVFYAGNKSDKNTLQATINIDLFSDKLNVKINNIDEIHTKSITFPLLIIIGSVVMIIGGTAALIYSIKSSKLSNFEYAKRSIFKHNKDSLIKGVINKDDLSKANLVNSFDELLKIQQIVSLPIVYEDIKNNEYNFLIKVGSNSYSYTLTDKINK